VAGGAVIAVVVVLLLLLVSNLNSLVAKAIEKHGGDVTRTSVRVSGVDISLRAGRGSIKGLRVSSPDGFKERTAFSLDEIVLDIDIKSVRRNPIVIDEIRIQTPVINAEITRTGASNIDELRKNVQEYGAKRLGKSGGSSDGAKRIRIERFIVEKGRVEVDASALGLEKRTIDLPEIRLTNVGGASGAPPDEIAKLILTTVAGNAASATAGSELDRLVREKLGGSITDKARELLKKSGN
jgi:uncharacterized protein involved in outer membrane biogenesis